MKRKEKSRLLLTHGNVGNLFDEGLDDFQGAGLATGMAGITGTMNGMNTTNEIFDWDAFAPFDEGFDYGFGDIATHTT